MDYIIMDLEWNQPVVAKKRIKGLDGDIIQIGALKVDENMNVKDELNITVKPKYYSRMNHNVQELTGITQSMIDNAEYNLESAIDKLKEWAGEDYSFVTWSFTDIYMLLNNFEKYEIDSKWIPECYDAQLMFDDLEMQEGRNYALNYALFHFNERPENSHDALDDAKSTVKILKHLDLSEGFTDYFAWGMSWNSQGSELLA